MTIFDPFIIQYENIEVFASFNTFWYNLPIGEINSTLYVIYRSVNKKTHAKHFLLILWTKCVCYDADRWDWGILLYTHLYNSLEHTD